MSFLVRAIRLEFDPLLEKVHPFLILLLQLGLKALVLDVLEVVHLEVLHSRHIDSLLVAVRIKSRLSVLSELHVVLVEDDVLHVVIWHSPHEELLLRAFLVACYDLIAVLKELQDLLEHRGHAGKSLGHLRGGLLREGLEALRTFSELLQLAKDLLSFALELLLQDLDGLGIVQLLFDQMVTVAEQGVDLSEQSFGGTRAILQVVVDTGLGVVRQHKDVVSLDLFGQDPGHDGLTVGNELLLLVFVGGGSLHLGHNLDQSGHIVVLSL